MLAWLSLALVVFVSTLALSKLWRRDHPNHIFIINLCNRHLGAESAQGKLTVLSSVRNQPVTPATYNKRRRTAS